MTAHDLLKKTRRALKDRSCWSDGLRYADANGQYVRTADGDRDERVTQRCVELTMRALCTDERLLIKACELMDEVIFGMYDRNQLIDRKCWALLEPEWMYVIESKFGYKAAMEVLDLAVKLAEEH